MANKQLDVSLMDSKAYKAFVKLVGDKQAQEMIEKSDEELKEVISAHTVAMEQASNETKAVPAYQSAVAVKKDFENALKEQQKPLKLATKLASVVLCARNNA